MDPQDPEAKKIWNHTLICLRREKKRRVLSLSLLTPAAIALLALLLFRPDAPPAATPVTAAAEIPWEPTPVAVLVMRDGIPTLEELLPSDLGDIELRFSLEPILADSRRLAQEY